MRCNDQSQLTDHPLAHTCNALDIIGIDFGNTIGEIDQVEPAVGAIYMICMLVFKFGRGRVFIVSKAKPAMQSRIQLWLDEQQFYDQTGVLRHNTIFVREYIDKARVVEDLGITIFFDDSAKVVHALAPLPTIRRIFWMHADVRSVRLIPKDQRHKVVFTNSWTKTMKFFQKIPSRKI